jgi:hypothetical protein
MIFVSLIFLYLTALSNAFLDSSLINDRRCRSSVRVLGEDDSIDAEQLLAKAKAIRESIPSTPIKKAPISDTNSFNLQPSAFALPPEKSIPGCNYRLNVDIGREEGTWMDPRWGASGRRVEFTLDVSFPPYMDIGLSDNGSALATEDIVRGLIKSATTNSNQVSNVYKMNYAPYARLRGGFDKMAVYNGGYLLETSSTRRSSSTLRFYLSVAGTNNDASYGDVSIPEGNLYFAVPYFGSTNASGGKSMVLSKKEGTVTVKQMGWNTGWRREESRILGIFYAAPLTQ